MADEVRVARTCDRMRPIYYAAASGDFNPVHLDPEAARRAGFESNILHGMCTFAWLAEACAASVGGAERIRRLRARFSRPVFPGDTITFAGRSEVTARNQRGEDVLTSIRVQAGPLAPVGADKAPGRYGPCRYEAGSEKIREFAAAISGGVPARSFGEGVQDPVTPPFAPLTFAAAVALEPCAAALRDAGVDLLRVLHGEEDIVIHLLVRPGDVLETAGEPVGREHKRSFEVITIRTRTWNQRGEAVLDATSAWVAR